MARNSDARVAWRGPGALCALAVALLLAATPRLRGLFLNTCLLSAGALAVSLPVGALLGVVVAKVDLPGRRTLAWLLVGLMFVPLYVHAGAWVSVLGTGGWWMRQTAGDGYADPWLAGWRGAIWVHGMAAVPWVALAVAAALSTVERRLEEESLLDTTPWRVLSRVSLRRASDGILAAATWVAFTCATEITVTDIFQIRTFAEEVYADASLGLLVAPVGFAAGNMVTAEPFVVRDLTLGVAALVLLALAAAWLLAPWLPAASTIAADAGWRWRPRRRWLGAALVWCVVAAVLVVPLAGLAWKAGLQPHGWSLGKLVAMVARSPWEFHREWGWSLAIGSLAALAATALGLLAAWQVRRRRRAAAPAAVVVALSAAIPAPLLGVWVIAMMNRPLESPLAWLTTLYDRTLAAPILVQMVRALPLATLWLWSHMASVPPDLLEAARSEGAGPVAQFWRVALPLRRPGVAAGLVAALAVAVGELSATLLVVPPGAMTISVRVFQLLHYGVDDRVAAFCLSIFGILAMAVLAAWAVSSVVRRGERDHRVSPPPTM